MNLLSEAKLSSMGSVCTLNNSGPFKKKSKKEKKKLEEKSLS